MNTGKLFPAHGLQDAVVDKLRLRALHGLQDLGYLLGGPEVVTLHGEPLAPGAFPGTAAPALFLFDSLHDSRNLCIFANENPSGEVSLPLAQNLNLMTSLRSMMRVKNQTLIEIRGLIRLSGFHFSYSFQGFRIPLFCHLLTLQRYKKSLKYARKIKRIFKKIITFLRKSLEVMGEFPIFATSNIIERFAPRAVKDARVNTQGIFYAHTLETCQRSHHAISGGHPVDISPWTKSMMFDDREGCRFPCLPGGDAPCREAGGPWLSKADVGSLTLPPFKAIIQMRRAIPVYSQTS